MKPNKYLQIFYSPENEGGKNEEGGSDEPKDKAPEEHSDLENLDPKELVKLIRATRSEAAANRVKAKELEAKLDGFQTKENKLKEEELKKKGEYQTLLTEKDAKIVELDKKAKLFDEYYTSEVESVKKTMGENWVEEFSNLSLTALKKLAATMTKEMQMKIDVDDPNKSKKEEVKLELTESDKEKARELYPHLTTERAYELYKGNLLKLKQLAKQKEK